MFPFSSFILKAPKGNRSVYLVKLDFAEPDTGVKAEGEAVFVVLLPRWFLSFVAVLVQTPLSTSTGLNSALIHTMEIEKEVKKVRIPLRSDTFELNRRHPEKVWRTPAGGLWIQAATIRFQNVCSYDFSRASHF